MGTPILHKGIVKDVTPSTVTVIVDPAEGNCTGCAIAALCSKGEQLTFDYPGAPASLVGKSVEIRVGEAARKRATMLFLVIPLVLLLGVSSLLMLLDASDITAVTVSLGIISLWYIVLYLFRKNIRKTNITITPV